MLAIKQYLLLNVQSAHILYSLFVKTYIFSDIVFYVHLFFVLYFYHVNHKLYFKSNIESAIINLNVWQKI